MGLRLAGPSMTMRSARRLLLALVLASSIATFAASGSEAGRSVSVDPVGRLRPWTAESDQADASFGTSVGSAGDVNGDGFDDVVVGASRYNNGQSDEGRAFAYYGSAGGPSMAPDWAAESDQHVSYFGHSVGTAGDVNGDGYADVIVGAWRYSHGQIKEGMAFLYLGSEGGLSVTRNWTAESDQVNASLGNSVGTAGDVNGDGYDDVIVGARYYSNGQEFEGAAFVYHGSPGGPSITADWTAESHQADAWFGGSVGSAGDVNGDGYDDVIVGAYNYDFGQEDEGRAFVYQGSADGLSVTPDWTAESDQRFAYFGYSVGAAGDVNGDGYADVIVGAYLFDNGQDGEGRSFVYHGSATGLSTTPDWTAESNQELAYFGASLGTAGDVNADGYDDVIVGTQQFDNDQTDEGRALLFLGSADGLSTTAGSKESDQDSASFGDSVATAGDVNGDGFDDVIVGAPGYDHGQEDEGRAFVYRARAG
jgi:hypothetical protein